ncbi:MAG: mandelate racemase/muconate lactonizing enzyme family protein [Patescibacteria group bacterium]
MKIVNIEAKKLNIKLTKPFSYFTASLKYLPYVLITIKTDMGIIGIGEASLAWDITGETNKGALDMIKYLELFVVGKNIDKLKDIEEIMENINLHIHSNSGLKCGVEMALLDALGKCKNKPVNQLFSNNKKVEYVIPQQVISFENHDEELLKSVVEPALKSKVRNFKFKVGNDLKSVINLLEKVSKYYPKLDIVFDVNQGWKDFKTAKKIIKKIEKYNISWIEQPISCHDYEGFSKLREITKIPIMADESCHNLLDLENLHKRKAIDYINIKLAKSGGILEALRMIKYCDKYKIKYMLGDMIHSSIGTAVNLHMATLGNFIAFDLTQPDRIKDDPASGIIFDNYKFFIPQKPGLGVRLK